MTHRALILLLLPFAAQADDPFACVDPDVVDAFLDSQYVESARYSTGLPAEAPDLPLPAELELVGSRATDSHFSIAYRFDGNAEVALSNSLESLKHAGWTDASTGGGGYQKGFRGGAVTRSTILCHQSEPGPLNIEAWGRARDALLEVSLFRHPVGHLCAAAPVTSSPVPELYLPDLELPQGAGMQRSRTEGGGEEYSAVVVVSTTLSPGALLRHFDEQIRTQGWTADSAWSGDRTVGSVWTRDDPRGQPVIGTLRIAEVSSGVLNARFTVISLVPHSRYERHHYEGDPSTLAVLD